MTAKLSYVSLYLLHVSIYKEPWTQHRTRKHWQLYRHADPRRQQQYTAVAALVTSSRVTVTVFITV